MTTRRRIWWAKTRRFFYLLSFGILNGECAVTGYVEGKCALIAAGTPAGSMKVIITKVFMADKRPVRIGTVYSLKDLCLNSIDR